MNSELLSIKTVKYQPDYKLHIHFNDGADKTVDFKPFLSQSQHPGIRAFLQPEKFQGFRGVIGVRPRLIQTVQINGRLQAIFEPITAPRDSGVSAT